MDGDLTAAEAEMAGAAMEAGARLRVAVAWWRSADADLAALTKPTWGGPVVNSWHRARDAAVDSLEACEAFEAFPPG
jgi:hypothetical protein